MLKMWNNCTEGNCDNYPTNAEHFVFQERSNIMQPGTRFAISAMVWQHPMTHCKMMQNLSW